VARNRVPRRRLLLETVRASRTGRIQVGIRRLAIGFRHLPNGGTMAKKILVVDDEWQIARLLQVNLQQAGYEVDVAHDGREALKKVDSYQPDLLVLDIAMPYADGFEI